MDAAEWKGGIDFGIITIREDEFEAVLQRLPERIGIARGRRVYNLRRMTLNGSSSYSLAVIRCLEQGNGEALDAARDLLEDLAPRWLLVTGIAGGAPAHELTLGDVVVSTRIIDFSVEAVLKDGSHEYVAGGGPIHREAAMLAANLPAIKDELGAWNTPESIGAPRPRVELTPERFYGDQDWQEKVRASLERHFWSGDRTPKVTAGALASSDKLVKDAERIQVWLRAARQFLAIEMESGGVHRAAQGRDVPFLAIRGISDIVGFTRDPAWTEYACHSAAAFMAAFLRTCPIPPREPAGVAPERALSGAPPLLFSPAQPPRPTAAPRAQPAAPSPAARASPLDGYDVLRTVYRGHYSEVLRVRAEETGRICIVKRSERGRISIKALERLAGLGGGNVLAPQRIWHDANHVYEEMPYIRGTRLSQAIVRGVGGLTGSVLECFCEQLDSTLEKLRGAGLIHRDVHPDNIFLLATPEAQAAGLLRDMPGIKYGVFGPESEQFLLSFLLVDSTFVITADEAASAAPVGHGSYTPPEQLRGEPSAASDLYALGATIYYGITGREIPPASRRLFDPVALGPMPNGRHSSRDFPDMLGQLLSIDPEKRPRSLWCDPNTVRASGTGLLRLSDGAEVLVINVFPSKTTIELAAELAARLKHKRSRLTAAIAALASPASDEDEWKRDNAVTSLNKVEDELERLYRALPLLKPR
ncbi:phosphorylase family protein [Sorangium sp. So ce363]|uniref:phosphorylase family protein n=1 Tax=Sorangium sp. So ce363 TaxID=3133304 RepID=UPI003F623A27